MFLYIGDLISKKGFTIEVSSCQGVEIEGFHCVLISGG